MQCERSSTWSNNILTETAVCTLFRPRWFHQFIKKRARKVRTPVFLNQWLVPVLCAMILPSTVCLSSLVFAFLLSYSFLPSFIIPFITKEKQEKWKQSQISFQKTYSKFTSKYASHKPKSMRMPQRMLLNNEVNTKNVMYHFANVFQRLLLKPLDQQINTSYDSSI